VSFSAVPGVEWFSNTLMQSKYGGHGIEAAFQDVFKAEHGCNGMLTLKDLTVSWQSGAFPSAFSILVSSMRIFLWADRYILSSVLRARRFIQQVTWQDQRTGLV
jgi:hypothetical protein